MPTLTNETTSITPDQMWANYTLNIGNQQGGDGSCTSSSNSSCFIRSNPEKGAMIPPVRSARLTTKGKKSIRYGQVEVVAKMPKGDWLWPAIWMMPEESVYGDWPRSGEIDIAESRGNDVKYAGGGRNLYYGTTHWGKTSTVIFHICIILTIKIRPYPHAAEPTPSMPGGRSARSPRRCTWALAAPVSRPARWRRKNANRPTRW